MNHFWFSLFTIHLSFISFIIIIENPCFQDEETYKISPPADSDSNFPSSAAAYDEGQPASEDSFFGGQSVAGEGYVQPAGEEAYGFQPLGVEDRYDGGQDYTPNNQFAVESSEGINWFDTWLVKLMKMRGTYVRWLLRSCCARMISEELIRFMPALYLSKWRNISNIREPSYSSEVPSNI